MEVKLFTSGVSVKTKRDVKARGYLCVREDRSLKETEEIVQFDKKSIKI